MKLAKSLGFFALALAACHREPKPNSNETTAQAVVASKAPPILANTQRVARVASGCELGGRIDLQRAKQNPGFAAARQKIMGNTLNGGAGLSSQPIADLEQAARSISFCEVHSGSGGRTRVVAFEGDYPNDVLQRIAKSAPNAREESSSAGALLNLGAKWLGRAPQGLVIADQRSALERALTGELLEPVSTTASMIEFHLAGAAAQKTVSGLCKATNLDQTTIADVTISVGADGQSSELRIGTLSQEAATALLTGLRKSLSDVMENPDRAREVGADKLSVEADERSVAIRCRAPLERFMRTITALQAKKSSQHD